MLKGYPPEKLFQKKLAKLQMEVGTTPKEFLGHRGSTFYVNDIEKIVRQELNNPIILEHLRLLPEDSSNLVSEMWQGEKWSCELTPELITPSIVHLGVTFYSGEVMRLQDGSFFCPTNWFTRHVDRDSSDGRLDSQRLWSKGHTVHLSAGSADGLRAYEFCLDKRTIIEVSLKEFGLNRVGVNEELARFGGSRVIGVFLKKGSLAGGPDLAKTYPALHPR